jgi:hypothetical protein
MSVINILFFLFTSATVHSATWKSVYKTAQGPAVTTVISSCPTGYVGVPAVLPYTPRYFCVSKYEMKKDPDGSTAVAAPTGSPWVSITRDNARAACQGLGVNYDLISNEQWQAIVRNIAGVASNWSSGTVASGALSNGHTDNTPNTQLNAVADDDDACNGTGQTCSSTVWDSQRRTHKLSNGNVIWDLGGNLAEWVTNDNTVKYATDTFASQMTAGDRMQIAYGAPTETICAAPAGAPYCGMGKGLFSGGDTGTMSRGGTYSIGTNAGIFTTDTRDQAANFRTDTGFRCVYVP